MSETAFDRLHRMSWLLPTGVATIGLLAVATAGSILIGERGEIAQHDRIQRYHVQSQVFAQRVVGHAGRLQRTPHTMSQRERRALVAQLLDATARIVEIQGARGLPDLDGAVDRLRSRVDRVRGFLEAGSPSDAVARDSLIRAAESLALAAAQLARLHTIEVRHSIAELTDHAARQMQILLVAALLIGAFAFGVSRRVVLALRKSFEREQEVLASSRERLAHSQKIEALGRLAGGVAHDFNNLLMVILGNAEALRTQLSAGSSLDGYASDIEAAGEQAASLTRQLLTFSRRGVAQIQSIDLNELVTESKNMLARVLREDIVLVTELGAGIEPVRGDRTQLQQVVLNLLLNARDALPDGGNVTVQTSTVSGPPPGRDASGADMAGADAYARLTVSDSGTGIPDEVRDRIFEPYFTTKTHEKGTGLGLATVLATVEENEGTIVVQSEEGVGTRFDVYLPVASGVPASVPVPATAVARGGNETVLVAEDQPDLRELATRILSEAGFEVLGAADGAEALRICETRAEPIDLILTDVVMPSMKGHELAERAKDSHPEARILFMSGYADDDDLLSDLRGSPERLLRKPFRRDELLSRVRAALDQQQPSR